MKKMIAMLLILAMMLALAACGSDKKASGGNEKPNFDLGNSVSVRVSRGTIYGDTYSNDFAEITFTKPSGWEYSTDEEIAQTLNVGADMLNLDMEEVLESTGSFYDMMAVDSGTGSSVQVMFENLKTTGNANISEEDYLLVLKQQLSASGMPYQAGDISSARLSGQQYACLETNLSYAGVDMEQIYYVRIESGYVIGVIATLINTSAADIEAMFS